MNPCLTLITVRSLLYQHYLRVFERLVLNQLILYINKETLLGPTVSGFRKGHSATTVLLGIRDALIRASSRGEVTLMVCVDYSKAFDNIQFRSVVSKMHSLGFSKYFLLWMTDCLTQRIEVSWCKLMTGSQIWQQWNSVFLRAQFWVRFSLRASSPVWGSEASLARTRAGGTFSRDSFHSPK